jgi:hypothetical protein
MSADPRLDRLRTAAAQRRLAIIALGALPLVAAICVLAARMGGPAAMLVVMSFAFAVAVGIAWRSWRAVDSVWLARRLDAASVQMDDSAALLFRDAAALSQLQRLQQARVRMRFARSDVDLRPVWPWPRLCAAFAIAVALLFVAARLPQHLGNEAQSNRVGVDGVARSTALVRTQIDIAAPAYTRVASRTESTLDVKAPEGSLLRWNLRFDPEPRGAALTFHDGSRLTLTRAGDAWRGERSLTASTLYRVELDGAPAPADDHLHRLDAIVDRAPEVRVLEPEKTLTLLDAQQKTWNLVFVADDDYGIAAAELQVTLAQGTGENIRFKEQAIPLQGEPVNVDGDARHQRFRHTLDLSALGIAQGDDVVVRLSVADNREPQPNTTRSASFILRWPVEASRESAGLEGVVQKTMPAYFRSQRQIIIDSEALLAERAKLDDGTFLTRADAIGVDQKILRLRYGQFLGEEAETHDQHAEVQEPSADAAEDKPHAAHDDHANAHALDAAQVAAKFGKEGDIAAEFGHVHDIAEAATLLDPETKATLKSALAEMWQAELYLRQGKPQDALPYEHRALEFIKQVQQSTRIYLERVGLELPPPDEARRLSGERNGVEDRVGTLIAASNDDAALVQLWSALQRAETPDWDAAETWLRAHAANMPDSLAVSAAIDRARRDPACAECRDALSSLLWPLLPPLAPATAVRPAADAAGRAYLQALQTDAGGER